MHQLPAFPPFLLLALPPEASKAKPQVRVEELTPVSASVPEQALLLEPGAVLPGAVLLILRNPTTRRNS